MPVAGGGSRPRTTAPQGVTTGSREAIFFGGFYARARVGPDV